MLLRKIGLLAVAFFASAAALAGTQRALLIGVSEYEAALTPLAGARNDVMLIRELLVQKYGFDSANIRIMLDGQATRDEILRAISELADSASTDDIVLIHYSGHGSQAPDDTGDEPDGFDETILPHDARTPGVPDITDDELNRLIGRFRSHSVIVILDSCHSGTGTRSGPSLVTQRWVAPDTRDELYRSPTTRQVVTLPVSEKHVFFAAAQEFESELDGPFGPDNLRLGLFTAAMLRVLVNSPVDATPTDLISGVSAQVEGLKASAAGMPIPEPNMEAPLEKQEQPLFVFSSDAATGDGSYVPDAFDTTGSETAVQAKSVFATSGGAPDPDLAQRIAAALDSEYRVAMSVDSADAVVDAVSPGRFDVYGPGGGIRVAAGVEGSLSGQGFEVIGQLVRLAPSLAELIGLSTRPSGFGMHLTAAGVPDTRSQKLSTRAVRVTAKTKNHKLEFYEDGAIRTRRNSLQLGVSSDRDCFLTLASIDSEGSVYLLLPNVAMDETGFLQNGKVDGGRSVFIPDSLEDDNLAGFYFDYYPPGGEDRVVATCFVSLADAEQFRAQVQRLEERVPPASPLVPVAARGLTDVRPGSAQEQQNVTAQPATAGWASSILLLDVGVD